MSDDDFGGSDLILPSQYFGELRGVGFCGEQKLLLAVLIDAINILHGWNGTGSKRKRRIFGEAAQWVRTPGTHAPFSFDSLCDALNIDPVVLRVRLERLMGHGDGRGPRLRLKEAGRAQHMTANRVRVHK